MTTLFLIKKSQPKMTGTDRSSSIMKEYSTSKFPRQTDITYYVPEGRMCLQTALTNWTPCIAFEFPTGMSQPQMTEQEAQSNWSEVIVN